MRRFIAPLLILLTLAAGIYGAQAFGLGEGNRFGRLGSFKKSGSSAPADCAVPDAPDGAVDLSKCSNAYYLAVILF